MEKDKFQVFSMDKSGMFEIPDNDNAVSKLVQGTGGFTCLTARKRLWIVRSLKMTVT